MAAIEGYGGSAVRGLRTAFCWRDLVAGLLAGAPGLPCSPPEGGMFVPLGTRASGLAGADLAWRMVA